MPTQCNAEQLEFPWVGRRRVVSAFDGGMISSDTGALLKIRPHGEAIERLWVTLFLEAHREAPAEIVLDLDATDARKTA